MKRWARTAALVGATLLGGAALAGPQMEQAPQPVLRPGAAASAIPAARPARAEKQGLAQVSTSNIGFRHWIDGFAARARAKGITPQVFDAALRGVKYNTDVIQKDRNQSEYTKQIWDYLDSAASPVRVENGKAALRDHGRVLRAIEAKYGVEKEVVAAVWGLESAYGSHRGTIPTIEALATLAYDGRRGAFFEAQLIDALKILQAGDVPASRMTGSWAGAMGHTQFIPSSYLAYAVDFTGDGRRDVWSDDPSDALASTAAYLARHGWVTGQPWGVEVVLPRGFNYGLASRKILKSPSEWAGLGVRGIDGRPVPDYGAASILLPAGSQGAAFMIFKNFSVIERYNVADAYVIGVGHLSDRLKGGPPIQASWPRGYKPLSFAEKQEMQRRLTRAGFLDDNVDGIIGPNTINAIRSFQKSRGVTQDGYPSQELLKLLKGG
jgi:membrane-bound lytic murein transglycosylase B